ncbi:hypothetical protein GA0115260_111015, partial [Streptomyces sp. MnatMP-M27]
MSRESDSSSSGPREGGGGAAYPSGTPPYGSRQYPSPNPAQEAPQGAAEDGRARAAAKPEEPKTETTLTTRIKINIPGSRPIPPVVMRTPVAEDGVPAPRSGGDDDAPERTSALPRVDFPPTPERGVPAEPGGAMEPSEPRQKKGGKGDGERTSDWFAPRRPRGGSSATGGTPKPPASPAPDATQGFPAPDVTQGFPSPETTQGFPAPDTTQGFPAPDPTQGFPSPETTQGFPAPQQGGGPVADLPYFTDAQSPSGHPEPTGPTTGPVTGDMYLPPSAPGGGPRDSDLLAPPGPGPASGPFGGDPQTPTGGVGPL